MPFSANIGEPLAAGKTTPRESGNKLPEPVTTKPSLNRRELRGVLIGMTLGDAFVYKQKKRTYASMVIEQVDKELILWKASILKQITSIYIAERKREGKSTTYRLQTKQHPIYQKIRDLIYPDGIKIVTLSILKGLTPLGIAIWYMDDGSLSKIYRRNRKKPELYLKLHTDRYGYRGNEIIQSYFRSYYDINFRIEKLDAKKSRLVMTRSEEIDKFMNLVAPYIIPSMRYKLATQSALEGEDIV